MKGLDTRLEQITRLIRMAFGRFLDVSGRPFTYPIFDKVVLRPIL